MKQAAKCRTNAQLADYLDLKSNSAISTWKAREKIPYAECDKISRFENIDLGWLITGKSLRRPGEERMDIADKGEGEPLTDTEGLIEIPELDVSFSAGPGSYPADHVLAIGRRPFSREWVRKKGLKPEHLALTRVCGDSMEPLLKDKDMVMLDQSVNSPVTAMPLAFRLDNELYIKLCQADGRGNLAMISANKIYDPILIDNVNPPPDFAIIAAVVWHAHSWI